MFEARTPDDWDEELPKPPAGIRPLDPAAREEDLAFWREMAQKPDQTLRVNEKVVGVLETVKEQHGFEDLHQALHFVFTLAATGEAQLRSLARLETVAELADEAIAPDGSKRKLSSPVSPAPPHPS